MSPSVLSLLLTLAALAHCQGPDHDNRPSSLLRPSMLRNHHDKTPSTLQNPHHNIPSRLLCNSHKQTFPRLSTGDAQRPKGRSPRTGRDQKSGYLLNFKDDCDHAPDSQGEYTRATLKIDFPKVWTLCVAVSVEAFRTGYNNVQMFTLYREDGQYYTGLTRVGNQYNLYTSTWASFLFYTSFQPSIYLTDWVRACLSTDFTTGMFVLVVDGEILQNVGELQ